MKINAVEGVRAGLERERARFAGERRVMSFDEYLDLYAAAPRRYGRDAARDGLREVGLAGAEVADQRDDVAGLRGGAERADVFTYLRATFGAYEEP